MPKRRRGSRGGRRVQRGRTRQTEYEVMVAEEEAIVETYRTLFIEARRIYEKALFDVSGLRIGAMHDPDEPRFHIPLPNGWSLEVTSGPGSGFGEGVPTALEPHRPLDRQRAFANAAARPAANASTQGQSAGETRSVGATSGRVRRTFRRTVRRFRGADKASRSFIESAPTIGHDRWTHTENAGSWCSSAGGGSSSSSRQPHRRSRRSSLLSRDDHPDSRSGSRSEPRVPTPSPPLRPGACALLKHTDDGPQAESIAKGA